MKRSDQIRVAAVIFNARFGAIELNLERMGRYAEEAADRGASLVCFPEMSITGYGTSASVAPYALPLSSPKLQGLQHIAEKRNITVLAGMAEKDGVSDRIFVSQLVFFPDRPVEVYRKLHIAPPEKTVFSQGENLPLFESHGFTFGIQLCYDAHFPFLSTRMAEKGADLLFIPHASPRGVPEEKFMSWMRHIPARAYDNGVFVVVCNQAGENGEGLSFPGIAFVTDPSGYLKARDVSGREGLLVADLSRKDLDHVRQHRMRYFLPNMRKDLAG